MNGYRGYQPQGNDNTPPPPPKHGSDMSRPRTLVDIGINIDTTPIDEAGAKLRRLLALVADVNAALRDFGVAGISEKPTVPPQCANCWPHPLGCLRCPHRL